MARKALHEFNPHSATKDGASHSAGTAAPTTTKVVLEAENVLPARDLLPLDDGEAPISNFIGINDPEVKRVALQLTAMVSRRGLYTN